MKRQAEEQEATIEERIANLAGAKKKTTKELLSILSALYCTLEPLFEEAIIVGSCGHCPCCYNILYSERAIKIDNLVFSDGGNCYRPGVWVAEASYYGYNCTRVAYYNDDNLTIAEDFTREIKHDIIATLSASKIKKEVVQLQKKEEEMQKLF